MAIFRLQNLFMCKELHFRNISIGIGGIRVKDKDSTNLKKNLVFKEPFGQFKAWFDDACRRKEILEPNSMCLATVSKDGYPSARFMLCKDYNKHGFKFVTNCQSRKAMDMAVNPNVAATFYWAVLNRSIRIEGCVAKLSEETKQTCASNQSTQTPSRGNYIICPRMIEFWQGQKDGLPDRIIFMKPALEVPDGKTLNLGDDGWVYQRI